MRTPWIIVMILSTLCYGEAQTYINFSEKDGLPSNHVYRITQDVDGYIWIATDEGLVKYNGTTFKVFTTKNGLPTNDIWNIFPGNNGKLWYIAKSSSLGYIENDQVHNFYHDKKNIMDPIYTGFDGDSMIPSGTRNSYYLDKDNQWKSAVYYKSTGLFPIAYLSNCTYKGILATDYDQGQKQIKIIDRNRAVHSLKDSLSYFRNEFRGQLTDSLFFTNSKTSYACINLNNLEYHQKTFQETLGIPVLNFGRVHLANNRLQLTGQDIVSFLNKDLIPEQITRIPEHLNSHFSFIDKENTVWIATFSHGIYKYVKNEDRLGKLIENKKINDIKTEGNKTIAMVNGKGFYTINTDNQSITPLLKTDDYLYDVSFIKETNSFYFLSKNYITSLNKHNQRGKIKIPFKRNEIARSLTYHQGKLYGHFTTGINQLNIENLQIEQFYILPGARCETSFKNQLIAGYSNGLMNIQNGQLSVIPNLKEFDKPVVDLKKIDDNWLLVCTAGFGVYVTDLKEMYLLENSEFLNANNPFYENGNLYLPTNKGLFHYKREKKKFTLVQVWDQSNGVPAQKINGVERINDSLYVATNEGLLLLPLDYGSSQSLMNLNIQHISYAGNELSTQKEVEFKHNGDLQVVIDHIDFREQSNFSYDYRLIPTKNNWTTTSSANIRFSDLAPDEYNLEIRSEGIHKSYSFTVVPRWYQTWWFYVFCGLGMIGLVVTITRFFSKKSQEKKNQELKQSQQLSDLQLKALRSQMNPHFVFNSLNAIQYYINENDFETSDTYLVKFSRLIREFFELSKEQLIPVEREILLLKNYLDLEKLRFKSKFEYEIITDEYLDTSDHLPSMLLQPLVENAVNHGIFNRMTNGLLQIEFKKKSQLNLVVIIKDNGRGYQFTKEDDRYKSSSVLQDRLKYFKNAGKWEIHIKRSNAYADPEFPGHQVTLSLKKINS
ncbi:hypothetical protein BST91_03660 [Nonlabens tegetincola]|uniref:sensor histidine kinase n=1 Tax=Nonlabens tegetincola TaxID=323273 RepID=UPI000A2030A0|nr:histidine kinase [Nonlabens tegetincola]ARN70806.1 hypothetical protein BST91_03660 [Nonlabens tegetincola]